jgi:hypothetical protein
METVEVPPPSVNSVEMAGVTVGYCRRGRCRRFDGGGSTSLFGYAPMDRARVFLAGFCTADGLDQGADPGGVAELFPRERELPDHVDAPCGER